MLTFEELTYEIQVSEEKSADLVGQLRKISVHEQNLEQIHSHLKETINHFGSNSRNQQNQSLAEELMERTTLSEQHFSDLFETARLEAQREQSRLEEEQSSLYKQRNELMPND